MKNAALVHQWKKFRRREQARRIAEAAEGAEHDASRRDLDVPRKAANVERTVGRRLRHSERVKKAMDAHKTQLENRALREYWLQVQKRNNYREEYNRIMGDLDAHSIFPHAVDRQRLLDRAAHLRQLGSQAVGAPRRRPSYNEVLSQAPRARDAPVRDAPFDRHATFVRNSIQVQNVLSQMLDGPEAETGSRPRSRCTRPARTQRPQAGRLCTPRFSPLLVH